MRKSGKGAYSIERVFDSLRAKFPLTIRARVLRAPFLSIGLTRRIASLLFFAVKTHGRIAHITGDIHYVAMVLNPRKTVLTVHDCYHLRRFTGCKLLLYRWLWFQLPLRRSAVVCAISDATKKELLDIAPSIEAKVVVIPDCVQPEFFENASPPPENVIPIILQVGTRENKNVERLVEALSGIKCVLHLIGEINSRQRELLNFHKIAYVNKIGLSDQELINEYKNCDVVAFASTYEGFGLPVIEANAMRRPVVTSDIDPLRAVAGNAAELVNPFRVEDIRRGFIKVMEDKGYRLRLVEAGKKNAAKYTPARVASLYASIYKRLTVQP